MRIGEVAAQARVSVRALRYYEQQELLSSERNAAGQRVYGPGAVARVLLIQRLYSSGLSSRTIRKVLPFADSGETPAELVELLAVERGRIEDEMADLRDAHEQLHRCIEQALGQDGAPDPSPAVGRPTPRRAAPRRTSPSLPEVADGRSDS